MTTIACNKFEMVGDSQYTNGYDTASKGFKVFKINNDIIGLTGDRDSGQLFLEWYKSGINNEKPDIQDFAALILTPEGIFEVFNKLIIHKVEAPFAAIGTGSQIALGSLASGKSPREAVRIACKYDIYSSLPVVYYER